MASRTVQKCVILITICIEFVYLMTTRCSYHMTQEKGHIFTPNFPHSYPSPISCEWVIEAPLDRKVAIYFTQFYLKKGLTAAEYTHYVREIRSGVGRFDFGTISSVDEPTYLVSNQRILVLSMRVRTQDNVHLRVREHLLDAAGFNITYEMIPRNESVREDACIYHHCSFTGYCFASKDYAAYICGCFADYFGDECQYDSDCGPNSSTSVCQNGGTCRYYIGSSIRTCECLPGFTGAKCEMKTLPDTDNNEESAIPNCHETLFHSLPSYRTIYPKFNHCNDFDFTIWRLEVSEPMPVAEGVPLLIACVVVNDSTVNVHWLKDGFPIDFRATHGRVWSLTIPRDSYGRETFLLGFDRTHVLDTGTITCNAWNEVKNESLSVQVSVQPLCKPIVTPLSSTVRVGSLVNITCVSKEDLFGSLSYSWWKNNVEIKAGQDAEKIEDLFPVGTRIVLREILESANYTCVVRAPSGSIRHSSVITVVDDAIFTKRTCQQFKSHGIRWKTTAIGKYDIHMCPMGYEGYVSRFCAEKNATGKGYWLEPDFSTCLSTLVSQVKTEFDSRKMGYRSKSMTFVLTELYNILSTKSSDMYASEGEAIVDFLSEADVQIFMEENSEVNWNEKIKLISFLRNITMLFGVMIFNEAVKFHHFESNCLSIDILRCSRDNSYITLCKHNEACSVVLQFKREPFNPYNHTDFATITISVIVYKCFSLISDLDDFISSKGTMDDYPTVSVDVMNVEQSDAQTIHTQFLISETDRESTVKCCRVDFSNRSISRYPCQFVSKTENVTICQCQGPGMFFFYNVKPFTQEYKIKDYSSTSICLALASLALLLILLLLCVQKVKRKLSLFQS